MGVNCTEASGCRLLLHLFKRKRLKINQKGSWERKQSEHPVIGLMSVRPRPCFKTELQVNVSRDPRKVFKPIKRFVVVFVTSLLIIVVAIAVINFAHFLPLYYFYFHFIFQM